MKETVFLRGIATSATVDLMGANIGGQLTCIGASFLAEEGDALDLQGAEVEGGFLFRGIESVKGRIDLTAAHAFDLVDDSASWDKVDDLILNGFTYDRITGDTTFTDHKSRLTWLAKGDHIGDTFCPQPYTQLAKVLTEMGHERDAREVRVVLARKLHRVYVGELRDAFAHAPLHDQTWTHLLGRTIIRSLNGTDWLFRSVVGYGFKPVRSLGWLIGMMLTCAVLASLTWRVGDFAPNSALILNSPAWEAVDTASHPAEAWGETVQGKDWETFSALAYAADVVIPIVEIGQTQAWAPSPARGGWGTALWIGKWFFTAAGWIVTALGAAAITGVIRRD